MRSLLLLFIVLAFFSPFSNAQEQNAPWRIGLKYGGGFMITHSTIMEYVSEQHFNKSELIFEKRLNGNKEWHQNLGNPYAGASFSHFQFNKNEYFGNAYSLSPYYSFILAQKGNVFVLLRTTVGVGWIEKPFDLEENHKNVAIGSNLNLFFSVLSEFHWKIHQQWDLSTGLNFSHFSNTGFKNPNLGINLPSAELGIVYQFGKDPELINQNENSSRELTDFFQFRLANGISENYPVEGPKFVATAFSLEYEKEISRVSNLGGGLDLYYNPAQKSKLAQDSIYIDSGWENLQIGLSMNYLLNFGKFSSGVKAGFYIKKEDDELKNVYQEIYGQHVVWKNLSAFVSLKTHLARAEYLLFGLKYSLR